MYVPKRPNVVLSMAQSTTRPPSLSSRARMRAGICGRRAGPPTWRTRRPSSSSAPMARWWAGRAACLTAESEARNCSAGDMVVVPEKSVCRHLQVEKHAAGGAIAAGGRVLGQPWADRSEGMLVHALARFLLIESLLTSTLPAAGQSGRDAAEQLVPPATGIRARLSWSRRQKRKRDIWSRAPTPRTGCCCLFSDTWLTISASSGRARNSCASPTLSRRFFRSPASQGFLIAGDSWISKQVPGSNQLQRSQSISRTTAAYSLVGAAAGSYAFGQFTGNDHLQRDRVS